MTLSRSDGERPVGRAVARRSPGSPEDADQVTSFVGRGLAWPLRVDHTGSIALSGGTPDLDESIRLVLLTAPGERLMRPQFGCRIWDLLFEPITPNLLGLIGQAVREALAQWEPRIVVDGVVPLPDPEHDGAVRVLIDYRVRATNDSRNLVFPFYVIPHDSD